MSSVRSFYNPIQKDSALFLETVKETNGKYTLVEVELAVGGGNELHYHKAYEEKFVCIEGQLHVQVGKEIHVLNPGDDIVAPPYTLHRFYNATEQPVKFSVTLSPGSRGFEEAIQISYGLASDGMTNKKGIPSKISHLGILLNLSESSLPGWQSVLASGLSWIGKRAVKKGKLEELRKQYVQL